MRAALAVALALCAAAAGCGEDDPPRPPDPAREPADAPAEPPPGWRTLRNERVGFTLALPPDWTARRRRSATLVRSADGRLALTIAADRSRPGREFSAGEYARRAFEALPGFAGLKVARSGRVRGSPYRSALVEGSGFARATGTRQRVAVAALQRPGLVSYSAIAFRDPAVEVGDERALRRVLASLRAMPPTP